MQILHFQYVSIHRNSRIFPQGAPEEDHREHKQGPRMICQCVVNLEQLFQREQRELPEHRAAILAMRRESP